MSEAGQALAVAEEQRVLRALETSDCDALPPVPNFCVALSNDDVQDERGELLLRSFKNWLQL